MRIEIRKTEASSTIFSGGFRCKTIDEKLIDEKAFKIDCLAAGQARVRADPSQVRIESNL
jgi:hypothetical protein